MEEEDAHEGDAHPPRECFRMQVARPRAKESSAACAAFQVVVFEKKGKMGLVRVAARVRASAHVARRADYTHELVRERMKTFVAVI